MFAPSFLRDGMPVLQGTRVRLRMPHARDFAEWAALRGESRAFLEPWEPRWALDELSRRAFRLRLRRNREDHARGTAVPFFIFETSDGLLAGGITLSNIRRGVAQSAHLGYWIGERHAGKGLMGEALGLLIPFTFETLRLHRIEAACIPRNGRSLRLLEKAGFRREGLLRSYLKINGSWEDHYLYALVADDVGAVVA